MLITSSNVGGLVPADKELYSATLFNFLGTDAVILRNLGQQHYSMKSDDLPAWLKGKMQTDRQRGRETSSGMDGFIALDK